MWPLGRGSRAPLCPSLLALEPEVGEGSQGGAGLSWLSPTSAEADRPERVTLVAPAQRGARSAGEVGMVRAGGGASCFIVTDPASFPEILPSSKKRKEKPREPLGLPGKGRANGNQGSHRSHGPGWRPGASCLGQRPISPETESGPQPEVSAELTNGIVPGQVHARWATFVAAELRQEKRKPRNHWASHRPFQILGLGETKA